MTAGVVARDPIWLRGTCRLSPGLLPQATSSGDELSALGRNPQLPKFRREISCVILKGIGYV